MTIKDNGHGFEVKKTLATKNVFGLESIYNRAKILGCHCNISSSEKGTIITIKKSK
jgi:signal transduction histidine kinase